ncbi:MAG: hypothetical protein K8I03_14290 [Ignavibacteria bacterium]|nr:hypothetical protein [Ignavibacteria bacterium]
MNTEKVNIINASEEYSDSFREALDSVSREKRFLAFTEAPDVESVRKFVRRLIRDGDVQVYAIHDNKVIGWCDIIRRTRDAMNHTGALGMGILKPFRGRV